jgi:hypothetical protein
MSQPNQNLIVDVGATANDGMGDPIRDAFIKTNENMANLFATVQSSPPTTLRGKPSDQAGQFAYDSEYFYYCFANYNASFPANIIWAIAGNPENSPVSTTAPVM